MIIQKAYCLIICLLLLNCSVQKQAVLKTQEKNLKLNYVLGIGKTTATGTQATTITLSDTKVHLYRNYPKYDQMDTVFYLSANNRDDLINVIQQSDFFSLEENYVNTTQSHSNAQTIKISIGNKTNSVSVCCLEDDKNPLGRIITKLYELIPAMNVKQY